MYSVKVIKYKMNNRNNYVPFIVIGLFYLPIILNNQLYVDDMFRAANGFDGWSAAGRPMTDFIMHFMLLSEGKLPGYGMFGQIISVIMMSLTAMFYACNALKSRNLVPMIVSCGFALNPFFIENILYQYDSLPMTISLCMAVLASVFATHKNSIHIITSSLLISMILSLYQTSLNAYISMVAVNIILLGIIEGADYKALIKSIGNSIASLIIGVIIYFIIIKYISPITGNRGQSFTIDASLINYFIGRLFRFYEVFVNSTSYIYSALIAILMASSVLISILRNNIRNSIVIIICLIVIAISPIGTLFIFKDSAISARILTGSVGIISISLGVISTYNISDTKKKIIFAIILIPLYVISYSSAFALKEQRFYDNSTVQMALGDIRNNARYDLSSYIVFAGKGTIAPLSRITVNRFSLTSMLLVPAYDWTASMAAQSLGVRNIRFNFARKEQKMISSKVCENNEKPFAETDAYSVFYNEKSNGFLVWLKGGKRTPC